MASLTPAAIQNENMHIHRGKGVEGTKISVVQNENLHIHKGKGIECLKAEVPKPMKAGRQERKALRDLSHVEKPVAAKGKSIATSLRDKSAANILEDKSIAPRQDTTKKASKCSVLTDEEIAKCHKWAKEGTEHIHFSGNDAQKFESRQREERVKKKVDKAMTGLRAWTDATFGFVFPVKVVPADTEDILKLEFEPEVLPHRPMTDILPKEASEEIEELFALDYDALYFEHQYDFKLKEEICG